MRDRSPTDARTHSPTEACDRSTDDDRSGHSSSGDTADETARLSRRGALATVAAAGVVGLAGCNGGSLIGGVTPRWTQSLPNAATAGPPAATDELVVVGGQDRRLHGFTAGGERAFRVETGGPVESRPAVPASGGPVHAHSTDGDIYTVSTDGSRRWHTEGRSHRGWLDRHGSLLVAVDPATDTVTGYDASEGTVRFRRSGWSYPFPLVTERVCLVLATTETGPTLQAFAPDTGDLLWESDLDEGYPLLAVTDDRLVTVHRGTIRRRRVRDGEILWETALDPTTGDGRRPIAVGDQVYVRLDRDDERDRLLAVDVDGGAVQWRAPVGYRLETITPAEDGVFAASLVDDPDGGAVIRLDAFDADGTRRWKETTDVATGGQIDTLGRVGNLLYTASDTALAAYDPAEGTRRWGYDPDSYRIGVTTGGDALYVAHRSTGELVRLPTD